MLLMIDTGPQFQQFMESIELTQTQVDRIESARKSLSSELEKAFGLRGEEVFAQGSFANGTAVRPVEGGQYDVDIVAATANDGDTAAGAIGDLYEALAHTRYKDMIEERKPCVRVTYSDDYIGGFHVDVVPVRVSASDDSDAPYEAPRKGSGWHPTAPAEYTEWCANSGEDFRRTVRMFKRWRDEQQDVRKAVKSVVLQVLVSHCMPTEVTDDAERLAATFAEMHALLRELEVPPRVANPVLEPEDLAARWSDSDFANFKNELKYAADLATEAIDADNLVEACEKWSEIFGDDSQLCRVKNSACRSLIAHTPGRRKVADGPSTSTRVTAYALWHRKSTGATVRRADTKAAVTRSMRRPSTICGSKQSLLVLLM
jgi:hypothetical protein